MAGTPLAKDAIRAGGLVIDLTAKLGAPPDSALAEQARTGRAPPESTPRPSQIRVSAADSDLGMPDDSAAPTSMRRRRRLGGSDSELFEVVGPAEETPADQGWMPPFDATVVERSDVEDGSRAGGPAPRRGTSPIFWAVALLWPVVVGGMLWISWVSRKHANEIAIAPAGPSTQDIENRIAAAKQRVTEDLRYEYQTEISRLVKEKDTEVAAAKQAVMLPTSQLAKVQEELKTAKDALGKERQLRLGAENELKLQIARLTRENASEKVPSPVNDKFPAGGTWLLNDRSQEDGYGEAIPLARLATGINAAGLEVGLPFHYAQLRTSKVGGKPVIEWCRKSIDQKDEWVPVVELKVVDDIAKWYWTSPGIPGPEREVLKNMQPFLRLTFTDAQNQVITVCRDPQIVTVGNSDVAFANPIPSGVNAQYAFVVVSPGVKPSGRTSPLAVALPGSPDIACTLRLEGGRINWNWQQQRETAEKRRREAEESGDKANIAKWSDIRDAYDKFSDVVAEYRLANNDLVLARITFKKGGAP